MVDHKIGGGVNDPRIVLLAPEDNVVVACRDLAADAVLVIDGSNVEIEMAIATGHKIARRAIEAGEKIVKYGAPIGSARRAIDAGAHVHTHNLASDYIPTFDRRGEELL